MCTNFLLMTGQNPTNYIVGRSMEFGLPTNPQVLVRAPHCAFTLHIATGDEPLNITPAYGYVGLNSCVHLNEENKDKGITLPVLSDGINEKGLTIGQLWLPGTLYQLAHAPQKDAKNVDPIIVPTYCFVDYVLANFATVQDVRDAFENKQKPLRVVAGDLRMDNGQVVPLHFPIIDAHGNSIVVEFEEYEVKIRDNPIGVCTNRPFLPWHLDNLANYANLTAIDPPMPEFTNTSLTMNGHGCGMLGLPGDYTPPSRFIRTAYLQKWAEQQETAEATMQLAFHVLNNVDIPKGTVRVEENDKQPDYTQWVVVKNLTEPEIRIRTYDSPLVYRVPLASLDFEAYIPKAPDELPPLVKIPTEPTSLELPGLKTKTP